MKKISITLVEYLILIIFVLLLILAVSFGLTFSSFVVFLFSISLIGWLILRRFREHKRIWLYFYRIINIGYSIFFVTFIIVQLLILSGAKYHVEEGDYDYILILGAGLRGEELSTILRLRLELAVDLSNEFPDSIIFVSGGQGPGEDITEAKAMTDYLVNNGVSRDRIMLEEMSTSTQENITFSKELINNYGERPLSGLLITNEFHMYRALKLADREGLNIEGVACSTPLIIRLNYLIREYFTIINSLIIG